MAILVSVVSRPYHADRSSFKPDGGAGGFQALKPAIAVYPQFLEMLVSRLSSADHALCANALQLINSLMRDAITNDNEAEWPKFIRRLQDLGVIKAVYVLMQSSALQDLAHPLLEFQALTKVLLRKWRDTPVDLVKPEHRRTIKGIHLSSNPERMPDMSPNEGENKYKHNPYKWRRLGFSSESPEGDFEDMGFLGMMDLSDYVRKHQDEFQHILMEQAANDSTKRCPIAQASLIVTAVLYEHFEVDKVETEDPKGYLALESRTNFDRVFKPLLLHWSRLHVAGLHAFFRLWKATGAEQEDFVKILELVRILFESVVGGAGRTKDVVDVEKELDEYSCEKLRELQMELLELTYDDVWGPQLRGAKDELQVEALQFVKEQRIRCLLAGAWFPNEMQYKGGDVAGPVTVSTTTPMAASGYKFVRLAPDRRYLHHADFAQMSDEPPDVATLPDRIDLSIVSSVVSNVAAARDPDGASNDLEKAIKDLSPEKMTTTKITIHGYVGRNSNRSIHSRQTSQGHSRNTSKSSSLSHSTHNMKESPLLHLYPVSQTQASEWLDGLLMLLNQQPITAETNKLVSTISSYGLKVRLLNVRFHEDEVVGEPPEMPSREDLDDDYYYEI